MVDSVVLEAFPAFDTLTRPPDDGEGAALKALDFGAVPINRLTRFEIDLSCKDPRAAVRQATPRPRAVEFPCVGAVPPRAPHHYVYGACAAHASLNNPIRDNTAHACRRRPLEAPARLPTRRVNTLPAQRPPRRV